MSTAPVRFSARSIRALLDEFASDWTLRTIAEVFEDNDVLPAPEGVAEVFSGERRSLAQRYLHTLDLKSDAGTHALAQVVGDVLLRHSSQFGGWATSGEPTALVRALERDGFVVDAEAGTVQAPLGGGPRLTDSTVSSLTNPAAILDQLDRLHGAIDKDPRLAVSSAKALIESTAKIVITQRGGIYEPSARTPALVRQCQELMGLTRKSSATLQAAEDQALSALLGSLSSVAHHVAEIRNKVGVDHGREDVPTWVSPRHARLVVGAAHVWCQFILETLQDEGAPWRQMGTVD